MNAARILFFILFLPLTLFCQKRQLDFVIPDLEIESQSSETSAYCTPGIINKSRSRGLEISYNLLQGGELDNAEGVFQEPYNRLKSLEALNIKVKIPLILKDGLKVLAGYSYQPEMYRFSRVGASYNEVFTHINNTRLKSNSFALYATKPIDEKYYAGLRIKASFNGDYEGWVDSDAQYMSYNATGIFGVKESNDLEWGLGVYYSKSFRSTRLLPILMYNRNFNSRWGLETVFPVVIMGRYNINPRSILLFGSEYNSRSYAIDVEQGYPQPTHYHLNHSELRLLFSLERRLVPWVWFNLEGGYQFNFNTGLADKTFEQNSFKIDPANNLFFKVGIFLSPPDRMMR